MKKRFLMFVVIALLLCLLGCSKNKVNIKEIEEKENKIYTVGITQYNDLESNVELRKGIVQGLRECGFKEGTNIVYKNQQAKNNDSYVSQINKKFVDDGCDMIVSIGTTCTRDAIELCKDKNINVVYCAVSDPKNEGFCNNDLHPIVNATGVIDKADADKNLSLIQNLYANTKTVGIMYAKKNLSSKKVVDEYKYYGSKKNIDIVTLAINSENDKELAYDTLSKKVDVIMLINDDIVESCGKYIIEQANMSKKPIFSITSNMVKEGALAGYTINSLEIGKEAGRVVAQVLNGEDIKSINVKQFDNYLFCVNKKTLESYGIDISNDIFKEAIIFE